MAVDSLLSQGLQEYHQVLREEGEVDFLSQPEKMYIMENGRDGDTADASTSDDQLVGSFVDSQFGTQCPTLSTDSDPAVGVDLSCLRGATDGVLVKPSFEVHFQSHCGAASMKDLIREFMRKAKESLVIVMDCFSDVELLCDLLEASRKRNVSVHLLLDHLNLSLFVSMWQGLKLSSRNFPKLSVRSVQGQTYCAKTGRKLTGQVCESFIITDWTEVLTGSYSFSWLSWQVHRSLAVLVKGSAVLPFHTEFLRLNSSSQAVPGFVSYIAVPPVLPFSNKTSHAPQKGNKFPSDATFPSKLSRIEDRKAEANAKVQFLTSLESNRSKEIAQPAGSGAQVRPKPPQNVSASAREPPGGAGRTHHGSQRTGETLNDSRNPWSPAQVSHVRAQLSSLTLPQQPLQASLEAVSQQRFCPVETEQKLDRDAAIKIPKTSSAVRCTQEPEPQKTKKGSTAALMLILELLFVKMFH
ncbi:hypothetical protein fugu_009734 [Takifugu bimaculatus]|uniref:Scaffolding anchor of CK1 domain-containing protein n=1 Tax=Takifugu bimaculatus TaxID=433685 RepID=A0A4Z2CDF3_9TELE|nr:hypothetical protein fugu_009734 [Takifugu bimaculatus]